MSKPKIFEPSRSVSPVELFRFRLERLGWDVTSVEIDLVRGTARLELRRGNRLVTFDARNGRATTTRERIRRTLARVGRRGDVTVVERLHTEFIGRARHEGIRSGLRWLSNYVGDNAAQPALCGEARAAFRLLLGANVDAADDAVKAEREACAEVCLSRERTHRNDRLNAKLLPAEEEAGFREDDAANCAAAIRARGQS